MRADEAWVDHRKQEEEAGRGRSASDPLGKTSEMMRRSCVGLTIIHLPSLSQPRVIDPQKPFSDHF